jgi:hypothetical protein
MMSMMVFDNRPPFRMTFTAYGPETKSAQGALSCRVVRRVFTMLPAK